jgi:hypothetical protein
MLAHPTGQKYCASCSAKKLDKYHRKQRALKRERKAFLKMTLEEKKEQEKYALNLVEEILEKLYPDNGSGQDALNAVAHTHTNKFFKGGA